MDMLGFSHCTQACGYEAPMSHHYQVAVPMHDRYLLPVHVCSSLAVKGARSHRNNTKACRDIHKHVECHAAKYQCQTDFTGASNTPVSQTQRTKVQRQHAPTQRTRKYNANTCKRHASTCKDSHASHAAPCDIRAPLARCCACRMCISSYRDARSGAQRL